MAVSGNKGLNLSYRMDSGKKTRSIFQAMIRRTKATTIWRLRRLPISNACMQVQHTHTHARTQAHTQTHNLHPACQLVCTCMELSLLEGGMSNVYLYLFINTNKMTVPLDIPRIFFGRPQLSGEKKQPSLKCPGNFILG